MGRRMLIWASFAWNSKRVGLNCEKSSPDKSFCKESLSLGIGLKFWNVFHKL